MGSQSSRPDTAETGGEQVTREKAADPVVQSVEEDDDEPDEW